jgi:hypothetical protein
MKPDFGVYLYQKGSNEGNFTFQSLKFEEIIKLDDDQFSFFTIYFHNEIEYALSLDFDNRILDQLILKISENFVRDDYSRLLSFVSDGSISNEEYKFKDYQIEVTVNTLAGPIFSNSNEYYAPFIITRIIDAGTFNESYV